MAKASSSVAVESRFTLTILVFLVSMSLFLTSFVFVQARQTKGQIDQLRAMIEQRR